MASVEDVNTRQIMHAHAWISYPQESRSDECAHRPASAFIAVCLIRRQLTLAVNGDSSRHYCITRSARSERLVFRPASVYCDTMSS
jgi:hypothetical protein